MLRALFSAIALAVFLAALLAPAAFEGVKVVFPDNTWPFSRIFDRVILVTLIISLLIFRRRLSLGELKGAFKQGNLSRRVSIFLSGAAISFVTSFSAAVFIVGTGELEWGGKALGYIAARIPIILLGAVAVSLIEESVFRLLFFGSFRERIGQISAALLSSIVYSTVHFIQPVSTYKYPGFSLWSGFGYLGVIFERLTLPGVEMGIIGLLLVGMVLCAVFAKTASIYLCMGLHSGWIIAIKLCFLTTATVPGHIYPEGLSRRYFLVGEPIAWISILLTFFIVLAVIRRKESNFSKSLGV